MAKDNGKISCDEAVRLDEATSLETLIRRRARGLIDAIVEEELEAALGAAESAPCPPAKMTAGSTHELGRRHLLMER